MQVFEGYTGMYRFEQLPDYARYILEHRLEDYIKESVHLSRKMKLPLLTHLRDWSDEQLIEYSKVTSAEYLNYLVQNKAKEEIQDSLAKWLQDQLHIVGKYEIAAEDLTLITNIRSRSLKKFITDYTTDIYTALKIVDELDLFNLGETTSATNTYINILKDKIDEEVFFNTKLANTSPGMVYVYDLAERKVIYSNQKTPNILGYTATEVERMGYNFIELVTHPDDLPEVYAHFRCFDNIKDEEICTFEHRLKDAQGQYHWIRNYESVFKRNEQGAVTQVIGAAYDITDEKKTSEDLQKRETQLVEAQVLARVGSFEWDIVADTTSNSDEFYKIFEYSDRKRFDYFMSRVHPADKEKLKTAFENAFVTGNYECEFRYMIDDHQKYVWSKGVVLFDSSRQPYKMIGTVQDITERRKIEETLLQKAIELEKTNADLVEFTYVASHDLKEPLRKIATYADMILEKQQNDLNETAKGYFQKIIDASRRMQQMIEDILALSSVSSINSKEDVCLQDILNDVLQMLEHIIQSKKAVVNSDHLPKVCVVPSLFRQLFLNLIGNAIKFARKNTPPVINITHSYLDEYKIITSEMQKARYLCMKIQDNGIGFSNEYSEKIFSLFQRLHGKKEYEGSGLGLSICKKIVEEHKGTITAYSEPDKGALFTIIIPLQ